MSQRLPSLMDCKTIMAETGLTRAAAERIMEQCPRVEVSGLRKYLVKRADVEKLIREEQAA